MKNILYVLWFAAILIIMVQKRTQIISFLVSIIVILIIWKKNISIKFLTSTIIISVLIGFVSSSAIIQSAIDGFINRGTGNDTISIREAGIDYYKEKVKESPVFGFGFPNENSQAAVIASGAEYKYYLADDGIYGFYYIFGMSGIIWIIIFWLKNLKLSYQMYKKYIYVFLCYFIYETVELYIGLKWYYYWPLAISLCISLLGSERIELEKKEEYNV